MNDNMHEIFKLAADHFFTKYRDKGGNQSKLAKKLGVSQSYISSVLSGARTASLELQCHIANLLYGPYEEFLAIGRRIKSGLDPEIHNFKEADDSAESLIARLSHYVIDHKRIEAELIHMRDFYESILKMLPAGVMVYSSEHIAIYVNPQMVGYIGIPEEKIIGADFYKASAEHPDRDLSGVVPYYEEAIKTLKPVYYQNTRVVTSGGNEMIMAGWMMPNARSGKFDGMTFTVINTTEQARLQQQVADEKDKIKSILDHVYSGIGLINSKGYITYANPAAAKKSEITREEFAQINIFNDDYKKIFPKADWDELLDIVRRAFITGEAEFFDGLNTLNPKGNPGARTGWVIPVKKGGDKVTGVAVTVRDDEEINLIKSKVEHLNKSLLATLEYADYPVAIALQENEGGPVTSYHMNREGMKLMGITQFAFDSDSIKKSMLASASLMKNGEEWLEFTKKNFTGRELAEMIIHMKDGRKFTWESKALRDQKENYYGRIVHLRKIRRNRRKADIEKRALL